MKRFTETTKWQDPWYRQLDPKQKCLWQYLCDACDSAGVIDPDWDLISFQIGGEVNEDCLSVFGKRVIKMDSGKLFVVGFLRFQYGSLSPDCKPHKPIFELCDRYGIDPETLEPKRVSKGYPKGINTLQEKDKEKEKDNKGECEGIIPDSLNTPEFATAWGQWKTHLKEKKVKRTPTSEQMQLKKLAGMGIDRAIDAIHHSIAGNYQGVYEPNQGNARTSLLEQKPQEWNFIN